MARTIVVDFEGAESSFAFRKLDRVALYGKRQRLAIDAKEQPCQRAALTRDGRFLLRGGMTAQGYVTHLGRWVPNSELVGLDESGQPVDLQPGTLGASQPLTPSSAKEILDLRVTTTYLLSPETVDSALALRLDEGCIFRFRFNFRSDYRSETAFLLAGDEGHFVIVGVPAAPVWVEPSFKAPEPEDGDEEDDELDFEMF